MARTGRPSSIIDGMKRCPSCRKWKSVLEFRPRFNKSQGKLRISYCVPCERERLRRYRLKHRTRAAKWEARWRLRNKDAAKRAERRWHLKGYGLTEASYEELANRQGRRCAICGCHESEVRRTKRLSVDHDHSTGRVRGLLCHRCNFGLGLFLDNPDRVWKALEYLSSGGVVGERVIS